MDVDATLATAWRQLGAQDYRGALTLLERMRARGGLGDDARFQLHHMLGHALKGLDRIEDALGEQRAAMALAPAHPEPIAEIAECLRELGRHVEAMNHYNRAVAMGASNPVTHYNHACTAALLGDHDGVLRSLAKAIELDESNRADAIADPDFAALLGLPALRALLRLPPARPPAWLASVTASVWGWRQLAPDEVAALGDAERPRAGQYDRICELWEVRLPGGERVRRRLFGYNQIVRPLRSRGGAYVALVIDQELGVIDAATDRQWLLTTGGDDFDNQLVGWSGDDQLLITRRGMDDDDAVLHVAARDGDDWSLRALDAIEDGLLTWSGSRATLLTGDGGELIELGLDGTRRTVCAVDAGDDGVGQPCERAGRYAFVAATRVWLTDEGGTPQPITDAAPFAYHQWPRLTDDSRWLSYLAGSATIVRRLDAGGAPTLQFPRASHVQVLDGSRAIAVSDDAGTVHVHPLDGPGEPWSCGAGVLVA